MARELVVVITDDMTKAPLTAAEATVVQLTVELLDGSDRKWESELDLGEESLGHFLADMTEWVKRGHPPTRENGRDSLLSVKKNTTNRGTGNTPLRRAYYAGMRQWADQRGRASDEPSDDSYWSNGHNGYVYSDGLRAEYNDWLTAMGDSDQIP